MSLLEKFVQCSLNENKSFTLHDVEKGRWFHFLQDEVGDARLIYGNYDFRDDFFVDINFKPELYAVVVGGMVYVLEEFHLGMWGTGDKQLYPKHSQSFGAYVKELNDWVRSDLFPAFYEGLIPCENVNELECKKRARAAVLECNPDVRSTVPPLKDVFDSQAALNILCGCARAEDAAKRYFEKVAPEWCRTKAEAIRIAELIAAGTEADTWEVRLAESLRAVTAALVTVEFAVNGKPAIGKLDPSTILTHLRERQSFVVGTFLRVFREKRFLPPLE